MQAPVIAAAAGFELLGFWFFDEEPNVADVLDPYHRGPIVAWRITRDGPKPISIQLSVPDYESGMSAILRPDGVVIDPLNQSWRDINMWAEDVIARWKEWREAES